MRTSISLALLASAVIIATPGKALPCLSSGFHVPGAAEDAASHGCNSEDGACQGGPAEGTGDDKRPRRDAPCHCPAECPSSSGFSKPPCPPIGSRCFAEALEFRCIAACAACSIPADTPLEDPFHPPRV